MFSLTDHLRQDQLPIEITSQNREKQEKRFITNAVFDHHGIEGLEPPPASRDMDRHILLDIFFTLKE